MWLMRTLGGERKGLIIERDIIGEKTHSIETSILLSSWRCTSISWTETMNKKGSESNHICCEWDGRPWDSLLVKEVSGRFISPALAVYKLPH